MRARSFAALARLLLHAYSNPACKLTYCALTTRRARTRAGYSYGLNGPSATTSKMPYMTGTAGTGAGGMQREMTTVYEMCVPRAFRMLHHAC